MKRKYISNMPIEGFSKYHICKNDRLYQYNIGIPRKDILEEFRISTKLLYSILRKHNVKLRKS